MRKVHRILTLVAYILVFAVNAVAAAAQPQSSTAQPQSSQAKVFAYDVVSVKPHKPGDRPISFGATPEGYRAVNIMVSWLIQNIYDLTLADQISGLPDWASDARFDFEAKMDEETVAEFRKLSHEQQQEQRQLMLQAVFADRFKLKVHHKIKEMGIYELVVAKSGCKFKESPPGETQRVMTGNGRIVLQAMPLDSVANSLSNETGRIVIDKTGLTGNYDLTLKWTPEQQRTADDSGPSVFTALEEQLGLKLVPAKGPVDTIVVDHIERPSEN